jgi:hypothetical protein
MQLKLYTRHNIRSKFPSGLNSIKVLLRQVKNPYKNRHSVITSGVFTVGQTGLPTLGNALKKIAFLVVFRIISTAQLIITCTYIT